MKFNTFVIIGSLTLAAFAAFAVFAGFAAFASNPYPPRLIVVQDRGGIPAQPYFEEAGVTPQLPDTSVLSGESPALKPVTEDAMLPVRSLRLSPGPVAARAIQAAGLSPVFLVGDDGLSRQWLVSRASALQQMNAVGLVVNVQSLSGLKALRALAPGLMLTPASGDDMGERLGLEHYPVLITATAIEQ
jgi:integrating conjugative element protein (TIGR03765 family)